MQVFSCIVQLQGNGINTTQVPKSLVSAAEVTILRKLHGADMIKDLTLIGDEKRSIEKERAHLERTYGKKMVDRMFGDPAVDEDRFPVKLSNFKPRGAGRADPVAEMAA